MGRLPYFPLPEDGYRMAMDVTALRPDCLIEVDDRYTHEIALKEEILRGDPRYYCQTPPDTLPLQWEMLELLLPNMARYYPERFALKVEGDRWLWENRPLSLSHGFVLGDPSSLPLAPLDWIGRQVQEDLLLMAEPPEGDMILAAGQLCFGSSWSLDEKMGLPFLALHERVPGFAEAVGRPANLLMSRLKPKRPVGRVNGSIAATDQLNLAPVMSHEWKGLRREVTPENAGDRCFLRLERQTLSRLSKTRGILFTIHTYLAPIREVADEPERLRRLIGVLQTMPEATVDYKGLSEYREPLLAYLLGRREMAG